jgi:hypothetical protein
MLFSLLLRKACEFESDARTRFAGDVVDGNIHQLAEFLRGFRAIIEDITKSNCSAHQLKQLAYKIDSMNFVSSLCETVSELLINIVCIAKIDLLAYPSILISEQHILLARLLRIASSIGLSRYKVTDLLSELEKSGNPRDSICEIERQVEIFMQSSSPNHSISVSLLRLLGLPSRPFKFDNFEQLLCDSNIFHMPHHMSEELAADWDSIKKELYSFTYREKNQDGLLIMDEMWELLNSAHEALMNIPVGFVDLDADLSVFISALKDIGVLLKNAPNTNQKELNQGIIEKLKKIIPTVEGYVREGFSERLEMRSRMVDKINSGLSEWPETQILLEPLLVKFVDVNLVAVFGRNKDGLKICTDELIERSIAFLDTQVDCYMEIIQRGDARISVAHDIMCEISDDRWRRNFDEESILRKQLRTTFEFAEWFGVKIFNRTCLSRFCERFQKLQIVISACIELRCFKSWIDLEDIEEDQIQKIETVLCRMVAIRRNSLFSSNEVDETAAELVRADDFLSHAIYEPAGAYTSWVTEHLFVVHFESFRALIHQRGVPSELVENILKYLELPERLASFTKKVDSLYRALRRKTGGPIGERLGDILELTIELPRRLLLIEIEWEVIEAEDPKQLAYRDNLEALYMDFVDLVQISGNIARLNEIAAADDIIEFLDNQVFRGYWLDSSRMIRCPEEAMIWLSELRSEIVHRFPNLT